MNDAHVRLLKCPPFWVWLTLCLCYQNCAPKVIHFTGCAGNSTPFLKSLHWLPVLDAAQTSCPYLQSLLIPYPCLPLNPYMLLQSCMWPLLFQLHQSQPLPGLLLPQLIALNPLLPLCLSWAPGRGSLTYNVQIPSENATVFLQPLKHRQLLPLVPQPLPPCPP